jgi:hypothetical protein
MKLYKLTRPYGQTRDNTQWSEGHTEIKEGPDYRLCSKTVVHAYRSLNLGLLLNPVHASIRDPLPWECEGTVEVEDYGKVGCSSLTTVKKIPLPDWYTDPHMRRKVQIRFAILCAESVLPLWDRYHPDERPAKAISAAKMLEATAALVAEGKADWNTWRKTRSDADQAARDSANASWNVHGDAWSIAKAATYAVYAATYAVYAAGCATCAPAEGMLTDDYRRIQYSNDAAQYAADSADSAGRAAESIGPNPAPGPPSAMVRIVERFDERIDFCQLADKAIQQCMEVKCTPSK